MFCVVLFIWFVFTPRTHMPSTRLAILHLAVIHLRDSNLIKKVTLLSTPFRAKLEIKKQTFLSLLFCS